MAAGCAVVATNMGGMITQVLDGHNGLLCPPTHEGLLEALLRCIDSGEDRLRMQRRGWETAQETFGVGKWRIRWTQIVSSVLEGA